MQGMRWGKPELECSMFQALIGKWLPHRAAIVSGLQLHNIIYLSSLLCTADSVSLLSPLIYWKRLLYSAAIASSLQLPI